jgi:hypothetical protein
MYRHKHSIKVLAPLPKTSKSADMEKKCDLLMAQNYDELIVYHPNRLRFKFKD